jgi:hypothetical protein
VVRGSRAALKLWRQVNIVRYQHRGADARGIRDKGSAMGSRGLEDAEHRLRSQGWEITNTGHDSRKSLRS